MKLTPQATRINTYTLENYKHSTPYITLRDACKQFPKLAEIYINSNYFEIVEISSMLKEGNSLKVYLTVEHDEISS